ncbi:MAG TPA: amidase [Alphaproteobacteria bacterium]|nr:amidase [Alphaproteobacteria bacterium]HAJ45489.1 amidase [Alphaproteobacteria bacterium]
MDSEEDLHWLTAKDLSTAFSTRELSPVEVTEWLLGRIEALDARINAFCLVDAPSALAQAEASEARYTVGEPLSTLDGVPMAIKDLLLSKGWPTLRGSRTVDPTQSWDADAPAVAHLREAGAVFLGKTTTPEFGHKATNDSPLTGSTRNPWNTDLTPGGSSGGAGAALAAGFTTLAFGTDAGGSVRIPASFCGVVGFKPTFGRIPAYPPSPFGTLAHVGPMARTVEDAVLFFLAMAKDDPRDAYYVPHETAGALRSLRHGVSGLRVAVSPRLGYVKDLDPEVEATAMTAARVLESLGARVDMIDPPISDPTPFFRRLFYANAHFLASQLPEDKRALTDPTFQRAVALGEPLSRLDLQTAQAQRVTYTAEWRQFMTRYDLVLTPQLAVLPFAVGRVAPVKENGDAWLDWSPFAYPFNLTGQPAISVPAGFSQSGLPIGVQIVGAHFADDLVLRAAFALETELDLIGRHPEGF